MAVRLLLTIGSWTVVDCTLLARSEPETGDGLAGCASLAAGELAEDPDGRIVLGFRATRGGSDET